ncbi:ABC transporter ATP-binding protein [Candidatus Sumerlaeota bacterium]|nr:ABC transporter ATP-binding protein [Candidatus Sumerlaeota bacterium]
MIEIRKLRKQFGAFVAVDDVSFSVDRGEVLGFLGPNGAGKSTTMKMITGFLTPTAGTAVVSGHDIGKEPMKAKEKIGYLPEGAPAYPEMTPQSFLRFVAEVRGLRGADRDRRVDEVVSRVSLESHLYVPIESLSKGYKRRVGLAQAIIHDPEVLVMDEPTDGLDPNQKFHVRNLIQKMAPNKATILSTHILEEVEAVCTRAIIIAAGRIIADGTPDELASRSANHNSVLLRLKRESGTQLREKLEKLPGVKRVEFKEDDAGASLHLFSERGRPILKDVSRLAFDQRVEVDEIREERGKLDEVFRELTHEATVKAGREN